MSIIIRAGLLIDGTGTPPQPDRDIVVEDGRITAIVPCGESPATGRRLVDASAMVVLPGLIDAHVHICSDPDPDPVRARAARTLAELVIRGVRNARLTIEGGITTIRTLGTPHDLDLHVRDAINMGMIPGPRIIAAGRGVSMTGGHGHYMTFEADGPDRVRKAVRTLIRSGVNCIKLFVTGGVMTPGGRPGVPQMNRDEIAAAIVEAHKMGLRVAAHAEGREGVNDAIAAGIDSIEHGYFLDNEEGIRLMLAHGTVLVPTIMAYALIAEGIGRGVPEEAAANAEMAIEYNTVGFRRAVEAGVTVAMGSDAGTAFNDHGRSWRELEHMVRHGMTPMQAIVAATRNGATLLGLGDELGTVTVGKRADLIVVDGDPLADIAQIGNVVWVLKDGVVVKGAA